VRSWLPARAGRWPVAIVGAALLAGLLFVSGVGLGRYWDHPKSPEGLVARFVRDPGQAGTARIPLNVAPPPDQSAQTNCKNAAKSEPPRSPPMASKKSTIGAAPTAGHTLF